MAKGQAADGVGRHVQHPGCAQPEYGACWGETQLAGRISAGGGCSVLCHSSSFLQAHRKIASTPQPFVRLLNRYGVVETLDQHYCLSCSCKWQH